MEAKQISSYFSFSPTVWRSFREMAKYVLEGNQFYQKKFSRIGISSISQLKTQKDFFSLPFTTKKELLDDQKRHPPFGRNASLPIEKYYFVHGTSGTTGGKSFLIPYSKKDYLAILPRGAKQFFHLGIRPGDRLYFISSAGGAHSIIDSAAYMGVLGIPWNMSSYYQTLQALRDTQTTVLLATPGYVLSLLDTAESDKFNLKSLSLRLIILASETINPVVSRQIEDSFGVPYRGFFVNVENKSGGISCVKSKGDILYHHLDQFGIFEIINPRTKRHALKGEMVLTNFWLYHYPFIRYRTGNWVELVTEPCKCGSKQKLFRFLGRVDAQIRFYARYFMPEQFERIVQSFPEVKEYRIELRKHLGIEFMLIRVVFSPLVKSDTTRLIQARFFKLTGIYPLVKVALPGLYKRVHWKRVRVVDLREKTITKRPGELPWIISSHLYNLFYYKLVNPLRRIFYSLDANPEK